MRTRKVRVAKRKSKAKRGGQAWKGFEYTNPTSSNLNLNLYSNQVGGGEESCEERVDRYCKKSCEKLCEHTEKLSKKEYEEKLRAEIAVLEAEIAPLLIEFKRLEKIAKDRYALLAHPLIRPQQGGLFNFFNFTKPPNKKCVDDCHASCIKGKKERCETIYKNTHKSELTRDIESLKLKKDNLKMNIANFNHSGIR